MHCLVYTLTGLLSIPLINYPAVEGVRKEHLLLVPKENAPKNGMQEPVKVEWKRNVGQKKLKLIAKKSVEGVPQENAPKNGMQRCVKVERKRDAGQKMLKRFAKKSVDSVGKNPLEGIKTTIQNQNINIIQQELQ